MSLWIILVVVGQFLNAIVALIDKYIVTSKRVIPKPFVYAFYISVLSSFGLLIYLFSWLPIPIPELMLPSFAAIESPTLLVLGLSFTAGFAFFQALVSLFSALQKADASDVAPVVGAVGALSTFLLSWAFLDAVLSKSFFVGFVLLILGTLMVSHYRFAWSVSLEAIHGGILFAVHYVAIKALFIETSFDNGFFWSRVAIVCIALSMLLVPKYYKSITAQTKSTGKRSGFFVVGNKIIAGIASLLLLKAIDIGDVSLVQALGALQYVFLLIFSLLLGGKMSPDCGENCGGRDMWQKTISIAIIVIGFYLLFE